MRVLALVAVAALTACAPMRPPPFAVPQSANPSAVIAAEIAFARDAREKGEYTAFRQYASNEATVFRPLPVSFLEFAKGMKDPVGATSWQPHAVYMSCDGRTAVSKGAWQVDGLSGYFTTVWQWIPKGKPDPRMPNAMSDGEWKWVLRHGDTLSAPLPAPEFIETKVASCKGRANAPLTAPDVGVQMKSGFSYDQSLNWEWQVHPDKSRTVSVRLWNGTDFDEVLVDRVAAPR